MSSKQTQLTALIAPVADGMKRMREVIAMQIGEGSPAVRDMTEHVGRFHGKQLRAALVLLAGDATSNSTDEHASIAAVVEMIHLATLVHDDVLDGASVRRRVACVNQRWDNQTAVLLGDFLYTRAFALSSNPVSTLAVRVPCPGAAPVNGSSAENGSSSSRMPGWPISARAMATRCCCPPDRSRGQRSA